MSTETDDLAERAGHLYAAHSAMAETTCPKHRLGIAEILRYLNNPSQSLTPEEQRVLFSDQRLRADYRRLKARATAFELPALAAASSGAVDVRRFPGGSVSTHRSRRPGQFYVILRFGSPTGSPRMMLLETTEGDLVKRVLPAADAQGEVVLVLDESSEADAAFLRLIADSTATGTFML